MTYPKYIVYSAGFNCSKYVKKHMDSIKNQTYQDYVHILVDDASTDDTYKVLQENNYDKTVIYRNKQNLRWLHNSTLYLTPNIENEEQVIVLVDMDDWLINNRVLETVDRIYSEENVWLTYGQFIFNDGRSKGNAKPAMGIIKARAFRRGPWIFQHLQTFKAFLWQNLDEEDFKLPSGKFAPCAYDRAIMYPLLEMCKPEKIRCIQDVLYVYNLGNPLCLEKTERPMQVHCEKHFRNKPQYSILDRK